MIETNYQTEWSKPMIKLNGQNGNKQVDETVPLNHHPTGASNTIFDITWWAVLQKACEYIKASRICQKRMMKLNGQKRIIKMNG